MEKTSLKSHKRTITLRIDEGVFTDILRKSSEDKSTFNSQVNRILSEYVSFWKYYDMLGLVPICSDSLKELFDCLEEERLEKVVACSVENAKKNMFLLWQKADNDGLISYFELLGKLYNFPVFYRTGGENNHIYYAEHQLGQKFSAFLKGMLENLLNDFALKGKVQSTEKSTILTITV